MMGTVLPSNLTPSDLPPAPRSRPVWPFIAVGVFACVAMVLAAGYVLAGPFVFSSGFKAANYFPRDTWMFGVVTVRPGWSQLWAARNLGEAFSAQPDFDEAVKATLSRDSFGGQLDVRSDVLPLVDGEMAVGVFGSTTKPDHLTLVHSSDPEKLLRVFATANQVSEPSARIQGALYYENSHGMVVAASGAGWLVAGSSRSVVEQALDRISAGSQNGLSQSDRYQSVVNRLPSDRFGFVYVDSQPLMNSPEMRRSLAQAGPSVEQYVAPLSARMAASLAATNDGLVLRSEGISDAPLRGHRDLDRGDTLRALEAMPSDTLFAVAGDSLPSLLAGLDEAMAASMRGVMGSRAPTFKISHWLGGEFAAGVSKGSLHVDSRGRTEGTPDVFLLARVKDADAANADLSVIDKLVSPKPTTVRGVPLKQIGATLDASAYYGIGGDWMYLLWGRPDDVLRQPDAKTVGMTGTPQYGLVRRALKPNGIAMYANLEEARRMLEDLAPAQSLETYTRSRAFFRPIKALGASLVTDDSGESHGEALLAISR